MNRLLLIIDPQVDFINGSLPVQGAVMAMDSLAEYISAEKSRYTAIAITADFHPADHCSFVTQGGEWPRHCIAHSAGAAIWPAVYDAAISTGLPVRIFTKGTDAGTEEYSVFRNQASREALTAWIKSLGIKEIDICGIAGDVCVLSSLRDGRELLPSTPFNVLLPYSPSIDGGTALNEAIR